MTTQKRRVIYLSDIAWDTAKRQAKDLSISAYIRTLITEGVVARVDRASQAERDAILRRINK